MLCRGRSLRSDLCASKVTAPALVVHGENNTLVPIALGAAVWPDPGAQALCGCCRRRAEPVLASARVVLGDEPDTGREVPPRTERLRIRHAGNQSGRLASLFGRGCTIDRAHLLRHQAGSKARVSLRPIHKARPPAHGLQSDDGLKQSVIRLMAPRSGRPRPG